MGKTYRVGIVGVGHVHVHNVALIYKRHPRVELVACADTPPAVPEIREAPYSRAWNLKYLVNDVGIPRRYDDYERMLEQERLDIVICNSENAQHPSVVEVCARHGAHVCVEKPMASGLSDALHMARTARAAGTKILIHWYMPFAAAMRKAKALLDQGAIGDVLQLNMRAAHAGPLAPGVRHPGPNIECAPMSGQELGATWWYQKAAGGGATIDFCSYGAILARWLIGQKAISATGMCANLNSPWGDVDDNGAIVARFPNALGVFEGSWTTQDRGRSGGPVIYGTSGTMLVEGSDRPVVRVFTNQGNATEYEAEPLPPGRTTVAEEFIHHLETGEPLHLTLDVEFNLDAMATVDAGLRSAQSGKTEIVAALPVEEDDRGLHAPASKPA